MVVRGVELERGRADQTRRATLAEWFQAVLAEDSAIGNPQAAAFLKSLSNHAEDVFQRHGGRAVAGKNLVSEREAFGSDDPGGHEFSVKRPVAARAAALSPGFGVGVALGMREGPASPKTLVTTMRRLCVSSG